MIIPLPGKLPGKIHGGIKMKIKKSYRLDESILKKLELLSDFEKKQAEKYNMKAKSITEIIEDAISEYYVMKLDKDTGTDYLTRMNLMIQDGIKQQNKQFDLMLNEILKNAMLSYEGILTVLKCQNLGDDNRPTNPIAAREIVHNNISIYQDAISDKIEDILTHGGE